MGMYTLLVAVVALLTPGLISAYRATGIVGDTLIIPCAYPEIGGPSLACWGRGTCSEPSCNHPIVTFYRSKVTWKKSIRYQVNRDINEDDLMMLTIPDVNLDDSGKYCCRVDFPNQGIKMRSEVKVEIRHFHLVRGSVNDPLLLPCSYSTESGTSSICWGRGHCGLFNCHNTILESDGDDVTWRKSKRYELDGNLAKGNVSLTIESANADDGGVYCCRVEVSGAFNDIKKEIRVEIQNVDHVSGLCGETFTLPCKYNVSDGTFPMCWGKGSCPTSKCTDTIISTDGDEVSFAESENYELRGKLQTGDVSLTIKRATNEDEGTYCCRVEVPGLFNDIMKEINLEIVYAGSD